MVILICLFLKPLLENRSGFLFFNFKIMNAKNTPNSINLNRILWNENSLVKFKRIISKKVPLIYEEFNTKILEVLNWSLPPQELLDFLVSKVTDFKQRDKRKKDRFLSWEMWRLAISEWSDDFLDTPAFEKEIEKVRNFVTKLL